MTNPRRQINLLFAIQLISMGAMEMSGPFWPVHLRVLTPSDDLFTFASIAVYVGPMLGIMLTSTFWGRMGDRFGHKAMMMRALLGLAITQFALAFAGDVWLVLVLRFLQGACAGYIAPAQAYGVCIENPARRAKLFAFLQVSTNFGSLIGALVGGVILDHATFFWINFSAAILCSSSFAAVWMLLPSVSPTPGGDRSSKRARSAKKAKTKDIFRSPQVILILAVLGALLLARLITQAPFSMYVLTILGAENWMVGLCYGVLALGFISSASPWARYFEGRAARDVLQGVCAVIAGCVVVTLVAGATRSIFVFTAMYFVWGALLGATTPILTSLVSRSVNDQKQGHVLGLTQSTAQFSSIAGIALGGWFSQSAGLSNVYFLVASVYLCALVLAAFARYRADDVARPTHQLGE